MFMKLLLGLALAVNAFNSQADVVFDTFGTVSPGYYQNWVWVVADNQWVARGFTAASDCRLDSVTLPLAWWGTTLPKTISLSTSPGGSALESWSATPTGGTDNEMDLLTFQSVQHTVLSAGSTYYVWLKSDAPKYTRGWAKATDGWAPGVVEFSLDQGAIWIAPWNTEVALRVEATAVPEPSAFLAGALFMAGVVGATVRKQRKEQK